MSAVKSMPDSLLFLPYSLNRKWERIPKRLPGICTGLARRTHFHSEKSESGKYQDGMGIVGFGGVA